MKLDQTLVTPGLVGETRWKLLLIAERTLEGAMQSSR